MKKELQPRVRRRIGGILVNTKLRGANMREPGNASPPVPAEQIVGPVRRNAAAAGHAEAHGADWNGSATQPAPLRIRLPRFLIEDEDDEVDEVGLGDVIKRATRAVGVAPCGGCQRRAAWLNRRVSFYR